MRLVNSSFLTNKKLLKITSANQRACVPDVQQLLVAPHPHGEQGDEHVSGGRRSRPPRVAGADVTDELLVCPCNDGAFHRKPQVFVSALDEDIQLTNPGKRKYVSQFE